MGNIKIDDLAAAITKELSAYNQDVTDGLKREVRTVARQCRDEIKAASPVLHGDYQKGWTAKVNYESSEDIRITVHNRDEYQLTHLLEYGHSGKGGTSESESPAYPHIRPAEERAAEALVKKVKVVVKR